MIQCCVSTIIPMYNAEKTIYQCLQSVLNQTYKGHLEVIIINDGSTDNSKTIVESFISANKLESWKLVNQENGGVSRARNAGLKLSKGDYIAFLDSDDQWLACKLDRQLEVFKNNDIDFLGSAIEGLTAIKGHTTNELRIIQLQDQIFKNYFQPSTVLMKKGVFDIVGYFKESQKYAEEGNYFMRVAAKFKCALLNEQTIIYGDGKSGFGESGLSANLVEMEKGELMNLRFAYQQKYINSFTYFIALTYSVLKFLRRIILTYFR